RRLRSGNASGGSSRSSRRRRLRRMPRSRRAFLRNRPRRRPRRASRSRHPTVVEGVGLAPGNPSRMDARAAPDRFLDSPSLSEGTRRAYRGDVGEFCAWLEKRRIDLAQVDIRVLSEYVASLGERRTRKLAPSTISRKLAAVRAFLRHALGPERVPDGRLA